MKAADHTERHIKRALASEAKERETDKEIREAALKPETPKTKDAEEE